MADRIAVVTGASGTLGTALVRLLTDRGLAVLAVSRSGASPQAGEVASVGADLGDDSAIETIKQALPPGDLAMAVHGIGLPGSPGVMDVDPAMLATAVDLKAGGFLRLIHAVEDRISTHSRLVAIGGHLGIEPSEHAPLAGVANAALANLVRQLVRPIGATGGTVHLIAPGPFDSPRVDALIAAKAAGEGVTTEEMRSRTLAEYPTGRMPQATDVAGVIVDLLAPHADAQHGSTLFLDAGARRGIF
jgi:NAD(P)-dependent dehydrogenase (short-subunit alcohol dehydrogenase family)